MIVHVELVPNSTVIPVSMVMGPALAALVLAAVVTLLPTDAALPYIPNV